MKAVTVGNEVLVEQAAVEDRANHRTILCVIEVKVTPMCRCPGNTVLLVVGKTNNRFNPVLSRFLVKNEMSFVPCGDQSIKCGVRH